MTNTMIMQTAKVNEALTESHRKTREENDKLVAQNAAMLAEYQRLAKQLSHDEETFSRRIRWLEDWKRKDAQKIERLQSLVDGPNKLVTQAIEEMDKVLAMAERLRSTRNDIAETIGADEWDPNDVY